MKSTHPFCIRAFVAAFIILVNVAMAQPSISPVIRDAQAAIDAGASHVTILPGEYVLEKTLRLAPTLRTLDIRDVKLVAAPGAFLGFDEVLVFCQECKDLVIVGYGAELRMQRSDYLLKPEYFAKNPDGTVKVDDRGRPIRSEYRHGLMFLGGENIIVEGLIATECGGDGIYIGATRDDRRLPARNVLVQHVTLVRNLRNNLSVTSCDGCTIRDSYTAAAVGLSPQSGMCLEPSHPRDQLRNIIVEDVISDGNIGSPFIVALSKVNETSMPVDVRFVNCNAINIAKGNPELRLNGVLNDLGNMRPGLPAVLITFDEQEWRN